MILSVLACGSDDPVARIGLSVRNDPTRPTLFSAPFPSDDVDADTLATWPNPEGIPFVDELVAAVDPADGFGTTSAIFFTLDGRLPEDVVLPDVHSSTASDSPVQLIALDTGERHPIDVHFTDDAGPFGARNMLTLLPLQGYPLRASTRYAAVVLPSLGLDPADATLPEAGLLAGDIAGITVFTTADPTEGLATFVDHARSLDPPTIGTFEAREVFDTFCVYEATTAFPVYQQGEPPFFGGGGAWTDSPEVQVTEESRVVVTIPKTKGPWPVVVMIRTGGGGDRPLVDRGPRGEPGGPALEEGTGLALEFAAAGFAGVSVDGPHGGLRNVTGGDEQFLIFNFSNPLAMRDNIRQSALELALLPEMLDVMELDASDCAKGELDTSRIALFGHSMGATIAPLVTASQPRYEALMLSGAGGSWIENIVYKQSPLEVRPLAEGILGYPAKGRELHSFDPALTLLQWAGEPADPPVYGEAWEGHVLMMQGIVDTYILPPIANATSASLGLDLAGPALDVDHPDLTDFRTAEEVLGLVGRERIELPVRANADGFTRVVTQHGEDAVEDGHEVVFQTKGPKRQIEEFLSSWTNGDAPRVP